MFLVLCTDLSKNFKINLLKDNSDELIIGVLFLVEFYLTFDYIM